VADTQSRIDALVAAIDQEPTRSSTAPDTEPAHIEPATSLRTLLENGTTAGGQALKNARLIARSPRVHDLERRSAIALPDLGWGRGDAAAAIREHCTGAAVCRVYRPGLRDYVRLLSNALFGGWGVWMRAERDHYRQRARPLT
jgi:hypothetical protein